MEATIMLFLQDMQLLLFKELLFYNADMVGNSAFLLTFCQLMSLGGGLIAINTTGGTFFVVLQ